MPERLRVCYDRILPQDLTAFCSIEKDARSITSGGVKGEEMAEWVHAAGALYRREFHATGYRQASRPTVEPTR